MASPGPEEPLDELTLAPRILEEKDLDEVLGSIDLKTFPIPVEIRRIPNKPFTLLVNIQTPHRDGSGKTVKVANEIYVYRDVDRTKLVNEIRDALHELLEHEVDEHMMVGGARIFDPHRD